MRFHISFFTVFIDKKFSASFTDIELVTFISLIDWVEFHFFKKCPRRDLNSHDFYKSADFKSDPSTDSGTRAVAPY